MANSIGEPRPTTIGIDAKQVKKTGPTSRRPSSPVTKGSPMTVYYGGICCLYCSFFPNDISDICGSKQRIWYQI